MARALELAALGLNTTDPNPRVGAVVARGEEVIGEGWHQRAGEPHAEVFALRAAGERARGATLYVTLEPCSHQGRTPPCADAVVAAGVARVVMAMADPNPRVNGGGNAKLRAAGIALESGLLEEEARELNPGFVQRMSRGRPWVRLKLGTSLDGRIALPSGESQWITGEESRADVQRWRARSSAILTSHATVLRDDPRLDVRLEGASRQPLRVILDGNLETPAVARILDKPGDVLIFTSAHGSLSREALESRGARVASIGRSATGGVDLRGVLEQLAREEMNEVWIECGARLAGAFVSEGLVDELIVYQAPALLGSEAVGMFHLPAPVALAQAPRWRFTDVRRIGEDLRIVARPREQNQ
ncbi:MAG TPA: bifunctional diaminohydroxyphosphoribosylaminopyrimidine deaminase/5-amino-6-(5-phosphoribosylamino)uracil reductase RibD [Steroidobacteraceae bacterium]|nr:bifunctional diaminohydroxyphosphoribosylaminopyrimidine deaminase/5-amino-6-(5-phosphoribosylamino)uracil reductase RibD [Steroidobacteraceae bacterium]